MRCKWTPKEEQFITDNYPLKGSEYCSKALNRERDVIVTKAKRMKVRRIRTRISSKQKSFVMSNYKTLSINSICEQAKLKHHQVYQLISRQGIKLSVWNQFSAKEEQVIRDNFATKSNKEIGEMVNRSADSIHAKLQSMNIKRTSNEAKLICARTCSNTYYSKGSLPYNTKSDGEISIRVYNGKRQKHVRVSVAYWIPLQNFNWEQVNGPVPEGKFLRCLSEDALDCRPDNWELVNRIDHLEKNLGRDTLDDKYITNLLSLRSKDLRPAIAEMPELIELKRNQIKMRRTINELS